MKFSPGDKITVTVNGREYETIIDEHKTQRFIANTAIRVLLDGNGRDFDRANARRGTQPSITLNNIIEQHYQGLIPLQDMIELYILMGYSVGGFSTLSFFAGVEIINPLWEEDTSAEG